MNIIIIGCGKVGSALAAQLSNEDHNLVVIDTNPQKVQEFSETYDVLGITGNASSISVLSNADVEHAHMLIAVTGSDELNLLCCLIAKKVSSCHTIARVRNPAYHKELNFIKKRLGISMIINPELAAAMEISRLLRFPSAIKLDTFAKGRVELLKFKVNSSFGLDGLSVMEIAERYRCDILICGVEREDDVFIPSGNFVIHDNDLVSIVASPKNSAAFFKKIGVHTHQVKTALIVGGGTLGYYLASLLSDMKIRVRIVESNRKRCDELSELLPTVTVICGDGTDKKLLLQEGLTQTESFITLTNLDEENLLLSLYAKRVSEAKLVTKVNRIAFDDIVESLDLGSVIYPKYITADYIMQYVRALENSFGSNVETLYQILDNQAEALEFCVKEESAVTGIPLSELDLKENLLVASINRNGKVHIPRGQDQILPGDTVVIVTTVKGLHDLTDILKR
ncbi:MAG TPA: Trk system potassium transporter TrkA [Candidatus Blautia merdavium]|uniref:Trk system potassium uptake protein TrkA n=1 Tax=Candidatus Blautia merdavium TaxID=2838494 RepID=A0A9D2PMA2_9FIRM|nr:Trk system potassium transporter TrkA [Candidatus Blautia merdavium]